MYWAILKKAGFAADEKKLRAKGLNSRHAKNFDCHFNESVRDQVYEYIGKDKPAQPTSLDELVAEIDAFAQYVNDKDNPDLISSSGKPLFDSDDRALLGFMRPNTGTGPTVLRPYTLYHAPDAGDFIQEIIGLLDAGRTVILDLGNATDKVRRYFADMLSTAVFRRQEEKFVSDQPGISVPPTMLDLSSQAGSWRGLVVVPQDCCEASSYCNEFAIFR
jgi:hypothetical protein